jgi:hypothetical protein
MPAGDITKGISVELSKRVADEVTAYGDNGKLFTSVQRLRAINDARIKIYNVLLSKFGIEGFINTFPEFVVEIPATGSPASLPAVAANLGALPTAFRKFISVKLIRTTNSAGTYPCRKIPIEEYEELLLDPLASPHACSTSEYGYCPLGSNVRFFDDGVNAIVGTYGGIYLKDIVDVTYSTDAPDPYIWQSEVIETAAEILLSQTSNN